MHFSYCGKNIPEPIIATNSISFSYVQGMNLNDQFECYFVCEDSIDAIPVATTTAYTGPDDTNPIVTTTAYTRPDDINPVVTTAAYTRPDDTNPVDTTVDETTSNGDMLPETTQGAPKVNKRYPYPLFPKLRRRVVKNLRPFRNILPYYPRNI